jgi:hypothetical protein
VTLSVIAWGYLVYAAIDFGATARDGNPDAWWFLAVASLGAVSCLFVGLILAARLLRRLGITSDAAPASPSAPSAPSVSPRPQVSDDRTPVAAQPVVAKPVAKPVGGRRAAR